MPIESPPPEVNYPPFVDPGAVQPPSARSLSFDRSVDEELVFQTGPIGDPNEDDRIFWRWFYNYDADAGFKLIFEDSPPEGRAPRQSTARPSGGPRRVRRHHPDSMAPKARAAPSIFHPVSNP